MRFNIAIIIYCILSVAITGGRSHSGINQVLRLSVDVNKNTSLKHRVMKGFRIERMNLLFSHSQDAKVEELPN